MEAYNMVVSTLLSIATLSLSFTWGYTTYKRNKKLDAKAEKKDDQNDIVQMVKSSMENLSIQLKDIKDNVSEIRKDLTTNKVLISSQDAKIKTLFINYQELKKEIDELRREIYHARKIKEN